MFKSSLWLGGSSFIYKNEKFHEYTFFALCLEQYFYNDICILFSGKSLNERESTSFISFEQTWCSLEISLSTQIHTLFIWYKDGIGVIRILQISILKLIFKQNFNSAPCLWKLFHPEMLEKQKSFICRKKQQQHNSYSNSTSVWSE